MINNPHGLSHFKGLFLSTPRILAGVVGLVMLTSGLLKATDIDLFIRQMGDYGIISNNIPLILSSWFVIIAECTLGTALIMSYQARLTIPLTEFLLLIFLGATIWAWITGVTEDCGCFGNLIHRSPGEALIEDLILMFALIPVWIRQRHLEKIEINLKSLAVIAACVTGLILPEIFSSPVSRISHYFDEVIYIQKRFPEIQDIVQMDLDHGSHILVLMSTDCQHCLESVEEFNIWARETDLPHLTVLTPNSEEQINTLIDEFWPEFPVLQIPEDKFWDLLENGDIPRIFLLIDGRILKIWDKKTPDISDIRKELAR